ncbi:MAG: polymer-forming cytoskeletal protein [Hydrogenophaga sp.]|jgi:cytoskeletal protein CcmA (bactofilin family)|nr:polymer-forming cytoskeletal protein [Hydrogenophaga sp.]
MNEQDQHKGSIVIGEGVTVTGSFVVPGRAVINGSLQGELQADDLLVGARGKLVGNVKVRKADIYGETHDTLQASEHLLIRSTGRISGKATYGEIEIERGGLVQGSVLPEGAPVTAPVIAPKFQASPATPAGNTTPDKPSV